MSRVYAPSDAGVVVVIGSGAGGGTLANTLAQSGVDVVCLEAGGRLTQNDIITDEALMAGRMGWNDRRAGAPTHQCKTVGGTTLSWHGMSPRLQERELRARTIYGHMDGASLIDWPLTFDELQPYYDRAERALGVSGAHGIAAFPETNNYKVLAAGARRVGYSRIDTRSIAIAAPSAGDRPSCQMLGFCNSGCAAGAKWSTLTSDIPLAENTDHFELRTGCMAVRINHNRAGRVSGVVYQTEDGDTVEQRARAICVAGGAIETARLLLASDSAAFPHGLGNSTGHVGRNYMRHVTAQVHAMMPGPVNYHRGPRQAGMVRDEHRHDPSRGFAGGYLIQTAALPPAGFAPMVEGWGYDAAGMMERYTQLAGLMIVGEDVPQDANRVRLHDTDRDEHGLPVPVIMYEDHPNSIAMREHAIAQGRAIYESLDASWLTDDPNGGVGIHNLGVARMSDRPDNGVTNRWGQAHDTPNLFVSDGGLLPTSGGANPTLTIVALALRQAEHIIERMAQGTL